MNLGDICSIFYGGYMIVFVQSNTEMIRICRFVYHSILINILVNYFLTPKNKNSLF